MKVLSVRLTDIDQAVLETGGAATGKSQTDVIKEALQLHAGQLPTTLPGKLAGEVGLIGGFARPVGLAENVRRHLRKQIRGKRNRRDRHHSRLGGDFRASEAGVGL